MGLQRVRHDLETRQQCTKCLYVSSFIYLFHQCVPEFLFDSQNSGCQGTVIIPLQFIAFKKGQTGKDGVIQDSTSQKKLCANVVAQIVAFSCGKNDENPNKFFAGGRPSSLIYGDELTPESLGALLAHYENKVMFQGFLWNVNSFDQEGVQLGKVLAKAVLADKMEPALKAFAGLLIQ